MRKLLILKSTKEYNSASRVTLHTGDGVMFLNGDLVGEVKFSFGDEDGYSVDGTPIEIKRSSFNDERLQENEFHFVFQGGYGRDDMYDKEYDEKEIPMPNLQDGYRMALCGRDFAESKKDNEMYVKMNHLAEVLNDHI